MLKESYLSPLRGQEIKEEQSLSMGQNLMFLISHLEHHSQIFSSESLWMVLSKNMWNKQGVS